ncbi:glycoside hydrolase family 13 protein [Peniophora sp. CONT]|nr:glycoside hydrolase family 13 protein [Peniophora sp. CONT]
MDAISSCGLGISSLMREAGNVRDPKEVSQIVWRDGLGKLINSMDEGPIYLCIITPLRGALPHALLCDQTHNNKTIASETSTGHMSSNVAIIVFGYCANGSVKGFD